MNITITQDNSRVEVLGSNGISIIEKLYELAIDPNNTLTLEGNISTNAAYDDAVTYLRNKFPNLDITVQDGNYYIRFRDEEFRRVCMEDKGWGDSVGITKTQSAQISNLQNLFANNITVSNLSDLEYFTSLNNNFDLVCYHTIQTLVSNGEIAYGEWSNPTIIQTIDNIKMPPNITINYDSHIFGTSDARNKIQINSIDWNGCSVCCTKSNASSVFNNCIFSESSESLIPNMTDFKGNNVQLFERCNLDKCIFPEGVTTLAENFNACRTSYIELPSTITDINELFYNFRRDTSLNNNGCVVIKAVTPPTLTLSGGYSCYPQHIYVPDNSVSAYQSASDGWSNSEVNSRITAMSQMTESERLLGTVTQEDIDRV